ncbi:MAG: HNH endonuclease [Ruminococcus sp.]|nr:HNH endonuclease [Ruminococcus sp.]MDE6677562.1 HNH endonuclease [Ruminococcus sp.]
MKKSCTYCGGVHDVGYVCTKKPHFKHNPKRNSREDKFRSSYDWQQKRKSILKRDFYLCRICLAESHLTYENLSVHHIVSLKNNFDLRLDDNNLITLCNVHHEQAEKGKISADILHNLIPPTSPE